MPREVEWHDGTCTFAEKDVRFVREAAIPPEGYRLEVASNGVTVASADDAGAFYARKTTRPIRDQSPTASPSVMVNEFICFCIEGAMSNVEFGIMRTRNTINRFWNGHCRRMMAGDKYYEN